jgi:ABC-type Fe3+ transport system permease subunit
MSSISQGLVLATAMVVSSTALFLAYCRQKSFPAPHLPENQNSQPPEEKILRSCLLCSGTVFFFFFFFFFFFSISVFLYSCVQSFDRLVSVWVFNFSCRCRGKEKGQKEEESAIR